MASRLVLLVLLASLSNGAAETQQATANPIRKVVNMLQAMQKKVAEEGEKETELFEKFMCYCKNGDEALAKSIAAAEAKTPQVTADIEAGESELKQLKLDLKSHQTDRAAAKAAMAEAKNIREKEAAVFAALKSEADANIAAVTKATAAISKGMDGAFLQTSAAQVLRNFVMAKNNIEDYQREELTAFLSNSETYAPASGQITGILKQMTDTMNADLAEATSAENSSIKAFNELMAAKEKEVSALTKAIEEKMVRMGNLQVEIVEMKEDLDDTGKALLEDKKFLANLDKNCKTKAAEHDANQKLRSEELLALADTTLAMLTTSMWCHWGLYRVKLRKQRLGNVFSYGPSGHSHFDDDSTRHSAWIDHDHGLHCLPVEGSFNRYGSEGPTTLRTFVFSEGFNTWEGDELTTLDEAEVVSAEKFDLDDDDDEGDPQITALLSDEEEEAESSDCDWDEDADWAKLLWGSSDDEDHDEAGEVALAPKRMGGLDLEATADDEEEVAEKFDLDDDDDEGDPEITALLSDEEEEAENSDWDDDDDWEKLLWGFSDDEDDDKDKAGEVALAPKTMRGLDLEATADAAAAQAQRKDDEHDLEAAAAVQTQPMVSAEELQAAKVREAAVLMHRARVKAAAAEANRADCQKQRQRNKKKRR